MNKINYLNNAIQELDGRQKRLKVAAVMAFLCCLLIIAQLMTPHTTAATRAIEQTGVWVPNEISQSGLRRISMISENDGWLLSIASGTAVNLARYDGTSWSDYGTVAHSQLISRQDLEMVSATDGWLVLGGGLGGGTPAESSIYRWDGSTWNLVTVITDPNSVSLGALDVLSANDVWAMGAGSFWGNLYHWDGTSWSFAGQTPPVVWADSDLDMLAADDGWAVGLTGDIAHWDGSSWSQVASPTTAHLNALEMLDSNLGWAVGDGGVILRWDGTAWTNYASPTTANLLDIEMVSTNEGWIVGEEVILRWDGSQWSLHTPPLADEFVDVDMLSESDGWIVGFDSLLRYEVQESALSMNYNTGAPGSYFNVFGQGFPPNEVAEITINGHLLGSLPVNDDGTLAFTLTTAGAAEGVYLVTVAANSSATQQFALSAADPVRPPEDPASTFEVPAGIAFTAFIYLPVVGR